jgi:hypothetical protein
LDVAESSGWNPELLPDQSAAGRGGSRNENIKALLHRGRSYSNINYLLLKAQRLAATKIEFVAFQKAA